MLRLAVLSRTYSLPWKNCTTTGIVPSADDASMSAIVGSITSWLAGTSTALTSPRLESRHPAQAARTRISAIRGTVMVQYPTSFRAPCQSIRARGRAKIPLTYRFLPYLVLHEGYTFTRFLNYSVS